MQHPWYQPSLTHILPQPQLFQEKDQQLLLHPQPIIRRNKQNKLMLEALCSELLIDSKLVKTNITNQYIAAQGHRHHNLKRYSNRNNTNEQQMHTKQTGLECG